MAEEVEAEPVGFQCPSDECGAVYSNPVAALHHYQKHGDSMHGGKDEVPDMLSSLAINKEPNRGVLMDHISEATGIQEPEIRKAIEELGMDPVFLDTYQLKNLEMVDMIDNILPLIGVMMDTVEDIEDTMQRANAEMSLLIEMNNRSTQDTTQTVQKTSTEPTGGGNDEDDEDEVSSSPQPSEPPKAGSQGGGSTDQEIREAEEEQVKTVLQRGELLGEDKLEIFMVIYKKRGDSMSVPQITNETALPGVVVEDIIPELVDMGLIDEDEDNDVYEYVY